MASAGYRGTSGTRRSCCGPRQLFLARAQQFIEPREPGGRAFRAAAPAARAHGPRGPRGDHRRAGLLERQAVADLQRMPTSYPPSCWKAARITGPSGAAWTGDVPATGCRAMIGTRCFRPPAAARVEAQPDHTGGRPDAQTNCPHRLDRNPENGSGQAEMTSSGVGTTRCRFPGGPDDAGGFTSPEELIAGADAATR